MQARGKPVALPQSSPASTGSGASGASMSYTRSGKQPTARSAPTWLGRRCGQGGGWRLGARGAFCAFKADSRHVRALLCACGVLPRRAAAGSLKMVHRLPVRASARRNGRRLSKGCDYVCLEGLGTRYGPAAASLPSPLTVTLGHCQWDRRHADFLPLIVHLLCEG